MNWRDINIKFRQPTVNVPILRLNLLIPQDAVETLLLASHNSDSHTTNNTITLNNNNNK